MPQTLLDIPETDSGKAYRKAAGVKHEYAALQKEQRKLERQIPTFETRMKDKSIRAGQRNQAELDLIEARRRLGQIPGELRELEEKARGAWADNQ